MKQNKQQLEHYRRKLKLIDDSIIKLVGKRTQIVINIGKIKRELKQAVEDHHQEREVLKRNERLGESLGLDPDFIKMISQKLIEYAKRTQNSIDQKTSQTQ